jgi:hypothetical protein
VQLASSGSSNGSTISGRSTPSNCRTITCLAAFSDVPVRATSFSACASMNAFRAFCAPVVATDLRASVSLVIAALAAEGELGRRT